MKKKRMNLGKEYMEITSVSFFISFKLYQNKVINKNVHRVSFRISWEKQLIIMEKTTLKISQASPYNSELGNRLRVPKDLY